MLGADTRHDEDICDHASVSVWQSTRYWIGMSHRECAYRQIISKNHATQQLVQKSKSKEDSAEGRESSLRESRKESLGALQ